MQASCKAALFAVKKSGTTFKRRLFKGMSLFLLVQHYNCSAFPCICVALLCRAAATFRHLRQSKLRQVFLALRVLLASPRVDGGVSRNVAHRATHHARLAALITYHVAKQLIAETSFSVVSRARAKRCSAEAPHTVWKRQMSAATLLCGGLPSGNRKPSVSEWRNLSRLLVSNYAARET